MDIALEIFQWIRKWCVVKTPGGDIIEDLPSKHLVEVLNALLAYKTKAEKRKLVGAPHCSLWKLKAQLLNVVECDALVKKLWNESKGDTTARLTTTLDEGCTVEWSVDAPIRIKAACKLFSFKPMF